MSAPLDIKFDSDQMKQFLEQALLSSITPEMREGIFREAVTQMVTRPKNSYGRESNSPLQIAFESAVNGLARDMAHKIIVEDEQMKAKIREKVNEMLARFISEDWQASDVIAEVFRKAYER